MNDRELIELAASAAGISSDGLGGCYDMEREAIWNPLKDDGDAFRLAVKLGFQVLTPDSEPTAVVKWYPWTDKYSVEELRGSDACAATRRAIVRAASQRAKQKV